MAKKKATTKDPGPSEADLAHILPALRPLATPLDQLLADPRNARRHPERNLAATQASLARFGQRKNVVARRQPDGALLLEAGHGTCAAARALGWRFVAAVVLEEGEREARAYGLADNRTAELAEWDVDELSVTLTELADADYRLDELGWTPEERPDAEPRESSEVDEDPNPNDDLPEGECPKPPFPWFGGKSRVAGAVWAALGDVDNFVEPFAGSLAVTLGRPAAHQGRLTTVNDLDAYVCNFWRALHAAPDEVAQHADWPVNETDLLARHAWLVNTGRERIAALEADPAHYDAQVAGWWVWGLCCWIGSGWCRGDGPHRPHLGSESQGVNRKLPHLGSERGVNRQLPHLGSERGVNRQRPHLGDEGLVAYMRELAERLRDVRVCCGDWKRVVTDGALSYGSTVGVFLDPPYLEDVRTADIYNADDSKTLAHDVRAWALEHGDDQRYRIVLAGYEPEHEAHMPARWRRVVWRGRACMKRSGVVTSQNDENRRLERLWVSPHCLWPARADA